MPPLFGAQFFCILLDKGQDFVAKNSLFEKMFLEKGLSFKVKIPIIPKKK